MKSFDVWITTFIEDYKDDVINFFIEKGYAISTASTSGKIATKSNSGIVVLALRLQKNNTTESNLNIRDLTRNLFESKKRSYFSILVQDNEETSWCPGALFMPEKSEDDDPSSRILN